MATKKLKYIEYFDGSYDVASRHVPKLDGANDFKELVKYLNQKGYEIKEDDCSIETDKAEERIKYHLKCKNIEITVQNHHDSDGTDGGKFSMGVECDVEILLEKDSMHSPELLVPEFNKIDKALGEYFNR